MTAGRKNRGRRRTGLGDGGVRSRGKAQAAGLLSGFPKGKAKSEADGSDLRLKLVGRASAVEDIVGPSAVTAGAGRGRTRIAGVAGKATVRAASHGATELFRVAESPTVTTLARWRDVRPDWAGHSPHIDGEWEFVASKGHASDVGRASTAASGRQSVAVNRDCVVVRQDSKEVLATLSPRFVRYGTILRRDGDGPRTGVEVHAGFGGYGDTVQRLEEGHARGLLLRLDADKAGPVRTGPEGHLAH